MKILRDTCATLILDSFPPLSRYIAVQGSLGTPLLSFGFNYSREYTTNSCYLNVEIRLAPFVFRTIEYVVDALKPKIKYFSEHFEFSGHHHHDILGSGTYRACMHIRSSCGSKCNSDVKSVRGMHSRVQVCEQNIWKAKS
jgi:hypothetical protein